MENAADALKIAFAMFVFVLAITVTFGIISQAKRASDVVLYHNDETNFYQYSESAEENRVVSVAEVISTLYRYDESIVVTVILESDIYKFDLKQGDYGTNTEVENKLKEFINGELFILDENTKFLEEFVEVPISGEYQMGEDGTEITLSSGGSQIYITYIMQ